MRDTFIKVNSASDNEEAILMEALMNNSSILGKVLPERTETARKRLEMYMESLGLKSPGEGYRRYGKFWVKETFSGEETLTKLLTEYVEKTASLKY